MFSLIELAQCPCVATGVIRIINVKCRYILENELTNQNKDIYFGLNHVFLTHNFQKYGIDDFATKFKS
jgi:predicted acetyltransferase